jgi:hypothetical protein
MKNPALPTRKDAFEASILVSSLLFALILL